MKNLQIYLLLTFSLLFQICLTSKLKSASEEKNSKGGHLVKTQSGKIYLQHTKKPVSSAEYTKKNSKRKDAKKSSKRKDKTKKKKIALDRDYDYKMKGIFFENSLVFFTQINVHCPLIIDF